MKNFINMNKILDRVGWGRPWDWTNEQYLLYRAVSVEDDGLLGRKSSLPLGTVQRSDRGLGQKIGVEVKAFKDLSCRFNVNEFWSSRFPTWFPVPSYTQDVQVLLDIVRVIPHCQLDFRMKRMRGQAPSNVVVLWISRYIFVYSFGIFCIHECKAFSNIGFHWICKCALPCEAYITNNFQF